MAPVSFQRFHGLERVRRAFDELSGGNVAEIVRGQIRQQAQVPCWSATCDARSRQRDAPDNCPAAANDLPGRRRFQRTPRSCGQASAERESGPAVSPAPRRASGRLIHQAIAGEANQRPSMGPATASAAGFDSQRDAAAAAMTGRDPHVDRSRRDPCGDCGPCRPTDSIRAAACA